MATTSAGDLAAAEIEARDSWMPMVVIGMAQILMTFNVSTLQVSIDSIASSFAAPATAIGTAIVTYSLVVAGLIMLGARVAQAFGSRKVFRAMVLLFGAAMALMMLSTGVVMMISAQLLAGAAAAAIVPTLVVLIADNYRGAQQAKALGWLGGAQALGTVLAFTIAGVLATWVGWRFTFGALVVLAAVVWKLGDRLTATMPKEGVDIDTVGIGLAAIAIFLISIGANSLTKWGALLAGPDAPFDLIDMSPAPIMILTGIFLLQAFVAWSRRRETHGRAPLISLDVMKTPGERSAVYCLFTIGAIVSALTFMLPLYVQVVQGGSGIDTAIAIIPLSLASFAGAVLAERLYDHAAPRSIARYAFLVVAIALALLGAVIRNDWGTPVVIVAMVIAGLADGVLIALLFNVLVSASPKELAGDVGSLRGCTNNLASGVGTALSGAVIVGLLNTAVHRDLVHNPAIADDLRAEIKFDTVPFISNDQLEAVLSERSAIAEEVTAAVRVNTEARLQSLKISFFSLSGIALLAFFPAGGLPSYRRREIPSGDALRTLSGAAAEAGSLARA